MDLPVEVDRPHCAADHIHWQRCSRADSPSHIHCFNKRAFHINFVAGGHVIMHSQFTRMCVKRDPKLLLFGGGGG